MGQGKEETKKRKKQGRSGMKGEGKNQEEGMGRKREDE